MVESPAKAKAINKYLGRDFKVIASMGHVRDLPKSKLGVVAEVDSDFAPDYVVLPDRAKVMKELREAAKGATHIFIATDPDREGEAIGWHLAEELAGKKVKIQRLMFNEITKKAIQEAIQHPGKIDMKMVDAQQARRVLDRLVGYKISPILWDKVRRGLSAGRVMVGGAEAGLPATGKPKSKFVPENAGTCSRASAARCLGIRHKAVQEERRSDQGRQRGRIQGHRYGPGARVLDRVVGHDEDAQRNAAPPFITSKLQQTAASPWKDDDAGTATL